LMTLLAPPLPWQTVSTATQSCALSAHPCPTYAAVVQLKELLPPGTSLYCLVHDRVDTQAVAMLLLLAQPLVGGTESRNDKQVSTRVWCACGAFPEVPPEGLVEEEVVQTPARVATSHDVIRWQPEEDAQHCLARQVCRPPRKCMPATRQSLCDEQKKVWKVPSRETSIFPEAQKEACQRK
jgi:hypothetical protein